MRDNLLAVGPDLVIRQKRAKRPKNFSGANVVPRQPPATPELASSARNGSGLSNGGTMRLCDWLGRTGAKAKAKKTPEEIAEENERTNEVGLFNPADAYLLYAKQLIENPPAHLRFDAPIDFLLFHAAELYLKSYLRQKGEDVEALKRFGHYRLARSSGTSRGEQFVG